MIPVTFLFYNSTPSECTRLAYEVSEEENFIVYWPKKENKNKTAYIHES